MNDYFWPESSDEEPDENLYYGWFWKFIAYVKSLFITYKHAFND